ncbi:hypothetical protein TIFTF001_019103 [Ficus carica]|uniref:Uncharacterized protein n=1 Tax=Ficus carica TaxID=3494 RepID=A0AA88AFF7_FICCA|nr:hypothetical protein TIFTF001_019103 [Ficus carica]
MSDYSSAPSRSAVFGVTDPVPLSVFGKEIREWKEGDEPSVRKTESVKMIDELNQKRLRELEEKETESRSAGLSYKEMRKSLLSLVELKLSFDDEKKKTNRRVRVSRSVRQARQLILLWHIW